MAVAMDQQQTYKYYCRICRKGFGCGRALGGHMRAHGIKGDVLGSDCDDEPSGFGSEWDDKLSPSASNPHMNSLRTNPGRVKTCRVCENCGKEFFSWKAFLEHGNGKCASEEDANADDYSMLSSPVSDFAEDDPPESRGYTGWSKGERSRRTKVAAGKANPGLVWPSSEEEELANCLVMMSASHVAVAETEDSSSCASAHKEEDYRWNPVERFTTIRALERPTSMPGAPLAHRGTFECKTCGKVFGSHQALGGHRASHKKMKGCCAAKPDDMDEYQPEEEVPSRGNYSEDMGPLAIVPFDHSAPLSMAPPPKNNNRARVHKCSICHRVFSSGQALGGHKRYHRMTSNNSIADAASMAKLHQLRVQTQQPQLLQLGPMFEKPEPLDLNLPAPADDDAGVRRRSEVPLSLDMPSGIFLQQPWMGSDTKGNSTDRKTNHDKDVNIALGFDEGGDRKIRQANLSDLKDLNMGGDKSPCLQVGIGLFTTR